MRQPRLLKKKETYTFDYPAANEFTEKQMENFWLPSEIKTDKDVQDLMVNMTPSERHAVITVLKLFTLYEVIVGNEYWGGRVSKYFKRPEIQKMASCFSFFELCVHAPFYNQINEAMMMNTDEFYASYVEDPTLKERMEFIDSYVSSKDQALSLGVFSLVEGAVLYSNFAFLKHFQQKGKNKITNIISGINFSVKDENLHAEAGAWLFRTLVEEYEMTEAELITLHSKIIDAAHKIFEHESRIIDMMFEKGKIEGITDKQLKNFVKSRIDLCLQNLNIGKIFNVEYNPIAEWFYEGINTLQFHDFFSSTGNEYGRNWDAGAFVWNVKQENQ